MKIVLWDEKGGMTMKRKTVGIFCVNWYEYEDGTGTILGKSKTYRLTAISRKKNIPKKELLRQTIEALSKQLNLLQLRYMEEIKREMRQKEEKEDEK